eukprot:768428-Hanusia_phi.AAC.3
MCGERADDVTCLSRPPLRLTRSQGGGDPIARACPQGPAGQSDTTGAGARGAAGGCAAVVLLPAREADACDGLHAGAAGRGADAGVLAASGGREDAGQGEEQSGNSARPLPAARTLPPLPLPRRRSRNHGRNVGGGRGGRVPVRVSAAVGRASGGRCPDAGPLQPARSLLPPLPQELSGPLDRRA